MTRKKKPLPILENITISDYAAEGKSIARVDDMVVFVPWAVPGDVVDLQVRRKKHSFMEAEVIRYHQYSKVRTQPFCQHFGICGGCKWQQVPYEEQLRMKQQQVYDQLHRIGKVELNLMRVAVYELYYDETIPASVAINEAVELGKRYGGENSPAFINGILTEVIRNYPLPEKTAAEETEESR